MANPAGAQPLCQSGARDRRECCLFHHATRGEADRNIYEAHPGAARKSVVPETPGLHRMTPEQLKWRRKQKNLNPTV